MLSTHKVICGFFGFFLSETGDFYKLLMFLLRNMFSSVFMGLFPDRKDFMAMNFFSG